MFKPSMRSPYDVDECIRRLNTEKDNYRKALADRTPGTALLTYVETQQGNSFTAACIYKRKGMRFMRYKGQIFEDRENGSALISGEFEMGRILKLAFYALLLPLGIAEMISISHWHCSLLHYGIYSVMGFIWYTIIFCTLNLVLTLKIKWCIYNYLDSVLQTYTYK